MPILLCHYEGDDGSILRQSMVRQQVTLRTFFFSFRPFRVDDGIPIRYQRRAGIIVGEPLAFSRAHS